MLALYFIDDYELAVVAVDDYLDMIHFDHLLRHILHVIHVKNFVQNEKNHRNQHVVVLLDCLHDCHLLLLRDPRHPESLSDEEVHICYL